MASLQMQFSQSSVHVECFLIPFLKTTRKKLSKNVFGFCLTFLEVVTKCIFKKRFLTIFVSFLAQFFSVICLLYFVRWWGPEGPPMRARRGPNALRRSQKEGPVGPRTSSISILSVCNSVILSLFAQLRLSRRICYGDVGASQEFLGNIKGNGDTWGLGTTFGGPRGATDKWFFYQQSLLYIIICCVLLNEQRPQTCSSDQTSRQSSITLCEIFYNYFSG